jgi:hypothetical protein
MKSVLVALLVLMPLLMPVSGAGAQETAPQTTTLPQVPPVTAAPPVVPPTVTAPTPMATPTEAGAPGQEGAAKGYAVDIHRLSVPPKIDGKLDDVVWKEANLLDNFIQIEPNGGQPAVQRTEVRMGYDAENLYFGIRCYDSEPDKIVGSSKTPDASLVSDDTISIVLDTFHDKRNAFLFIVNPIGAKTDGLIRNEGEEVNTDWSGVWQAATSRDSQGWTAEIAIPFRTLRYSSNKAFQDWGFNVRRFVARTQESSLWRPIARRPGDLTPYLISEYGEIRGLSELGTSGGRYQLVPYGIVRNDKDFRKSQTTTTDFGGDLKINVSSDLVADLTVHTDFAEVEADQQTINLERYKLFYPERRPFFLEGANLFYFGDRPEPFAVPEQFTFFFSRQIGLAEDGRVVIPVLGGGKLTGREGNTSIGVLNMTTEAADYFDASGNRVHEPQTNYSVVRLKQQIFGDSTIGLIGLNKDPAGSAYNRGTGLDWDLDLGHGLFSAGYVAQTDTPGVSNRDSAYSADLVYKAPWARIRYRYSDIGDNFNPELGFLTRAGIIKNHFNIISNINLESNPFGVHRIQLVGDSNHITNQQGELETQLDTVEANFSSTTGMGVAFLYYDDLENLQEPLLIVKNVVIPVGNYRFRSLFTGISSGYTHEVGFTFWYQEGGYYGGDRLHTFLSVLYRPFEGLVINPTFDRVRVNAPWGNFVTKIAQNSLDYSITTTLSARLTLQWQQDDNFRADFILDWMWRPESHFFFIYKDIQDLDIDRRDTGFSTLSPGREFLIKATRRFDF